VLRSQGKLDEAVWHLRAALAAKPDYVEARNNLAAALGAQGKIAEAIEHLRQVLAVRPDHAEARGNLANALRMQGKFAEAIDQYRRALAIKPDSTLTRYNLCSTLAMTDQVTEALECFREAARRKPDQPGPLMEIAWILATHPDPDIRQPAEAIHFGERAAALTRYQDASVLDALAAAYAAAGQFDRAVTTAQRALQWATADQAQKLAEQTRQRLELYQQGKPYREPSPEQAGIRP
jgi:tetratricopeptide (TPR) repeat protein